MKVTVSFLKSNENSVTTISLIEQTDCDSIHVDVMDGKFVKRKTLSVEDIIELFKNTSKPLDIHLMVEDPLDYIPYLVNLNVNSFTVHAELQENLNEIINYIHSNGIRAGLAINPDTSTDILLPYLDKIEYVLVMSVYPGEGGQKLIPETLDKVAILKALRKQFNYPYQINVDGGVNKETRKLLNDCDLLVSGSYICLSDDYQERIDSLR